MALPELFGDQNRPAYVDFYINTAGSIIAETDVPGNSSLGARGVFNKSVISTPNGDTLDNYIIQSIYAEYYYTPETDSLDWHNPGDYISGGAAFYGLRCNEVDADYFYYQVGVSGMFAAGNVCGGSKVANTGFASARPIRFRIKAVRV